MSFITNWISGGGGGPPTPKRSSTASTLPSHLGTSHAKPRPLSPKLTTGTPTPITEYPPPSSSSHPHTHPHPQTHAHTATVTVPVDAQWEDVTKPSMAGSPPSAAGEEEEETDEMAFERLGYSQIDYVEGYSVPGGLPPSFSASSSSSPPQMRVKEEGGGGGGGGERSKRERERERSDRNSKAAELKGNGRSEREREKESASTSSRSRRERDRDRDRDRERDREREKEREKLGDAPAPGIATTSLVDTLKEENDKLKTMIQHHVQQLTQAQDELHHERTRLVAETDRLKGELDASGGAHAEEVEKWKKSLQEHKGRIEYLASERDRLRRDRNDVATKTHEEIERLKQAHAKENEDTKAAIEEINHNHAQARSELRKVKKALDECAPKLDDSVHEIERLHRELAHMRDVARMATELQRRLEMQTKDLEMARNESSTLKKQFGEVMILLEDRTSELKGAQSFLTTADSFSGAEVTNTLQRLNAEVLQSTAFMAESMVEAFFSDEVARGTKSADQIDGSRRAAGIIGDVIVHFLGTKHHKEDPILVQIAFQAYLTYHLRWIADAWIIGGEAEHNRFVDAMYQNVREREAQAIAGRWRSLTRANVPSTPFDPIQITLQIATRMVSGLCDILLAAGCTASQADITKALSSKFTDKLSLLVSLAMRVNKIVGEDVTSGDLEVLAVTPATTFDGAWMEDSYEDGSAAKTKAPSTHKVLCATDLGLRKRTRVAMTGEREKQWEIKVLLKPKVALESVIEIMDD